MKKYNLIVMTGDRLDRYSVIAEYFHSTTNNSSSSGFYSFHTKKKLVACYPISKTIIESIEETPTEDGQ